MKALEGFQQQRMGQITSQISARNLQFFQDEVNKLDGWAEDLKVGLEREIKELDRQIKEARRGATAALSLEEKLAGQKQVRTLEAQRSQKRRSLFDAQDEVDSRREELIEAIEGKLEQNSSLNPLFIISWSIQ
jgi:adenine-specific DNA-methyltransferase